MSRAPDSHRVAPEPWSDEDFRTIASLAVSRHCLAMPAHRLGLLRARLRVRLASRGIPSFSNFHEYLIRGGPDGPDMQLLIDLGTVNHTTFFREPGPLLRIADDLAARVRVAGPNPVRAWSAGCSAGQEPYSLAMLLAERLTLPLPSQIEILASDLSRDVLEAAARAVYDDRDLSGVSDDRLKRFFLQGRGVQDGTCRVSPEIRRVVTFRNFDLRSSEWPIPSGLDAILCRNVLIYFSEAERPAMLDRLAAKLKPGGLLVLGHCEILPDRPGSLVKDSSSALKKVVAS